jgi:hypothetical protein
MQLVIVIPNAILTVAIQRFVRRSRLIASATGAVCECCAGAVSLGNEFDFRVSPLLAAFGSFLGFAMQWRRLSRSWPSIATKLIGDRMAVF